jgi:hypothetical protein
VGAVKQASLPAQKRYIVCGFIAYLVMDLVAQAVLKHGHPSCFAGQVRVMWTYVLKAVRAS